MDPIYEQMYKVGLVRSTTDKWIGGVCGGIANKIGADAGAVRLVTFLVMVLVAGSPFLLYAVAWLLMPDDTWVPPIDRGPQYPNVDPGPNSGPQDYIPPNR